MQNKQNKRNGFTLIELLVVISIMAILFLITIPNYNNQQRRNEVKNSAKEFRSLLWEAQSRALAPTTVNVKEYDIGLITMCGNAVNVLLQEVNLDNSQKEIGKWNLGNNLCIDSIKVKNGGAVITQANPVNISYQVGDNRTAGTLLFRDQGGVEIPGNEMTITVKSSVITTKYDIILNKETGNISMLMDTN